MKRMLLYFLLIAVLALSYAAGCAGRGDDEGNEDLEPFLYQESFEIWPDPAELYEDATFYFGWKDHDGDMEDPTILVRLVTEADESILLDAENIDVEGEKSGSLSFKIRIQDGYQGTYYIVVQDEDGNLSNEISRFLYVNNEPPEDEE